MTDYVRSALFIHTQDSESICDPLIHNNLSVEVSPLAFDTLLRNPQKWLTNTEHVVVSGSQETIKKVIELALDYKFSLGLIPLRNQKNLSQSLDLPRTTIAAIELALRHDPQYMDLILCNGHILLFKAAIGRIPLLDTPSKISFLGALTKVRKNFKGLKLLLFNFKTSSNQTINTAASGCIIIQHQKNRLASGLIPSDSSMMDGMISLLIVSPFSVIAYLKFLIQLFQSPVESKRLPQVIGYIRSNEIDIIPETKLDVWIDGEKTTQTPLHCKTLPKAIRVNAGDFLQAANENQLKPKEQIKVANLPRGKELLKTKDKTIPFFSYASEERFRDLFKELREDANINGTYIMLMLLSTLLATVGLYLDSAAVIIGAMLLAPLMTPIVSLAMGLLRNVSSLLSNSILKIITGIIIALLASSLISIIFPYKPVTDEMLGRLNPSLLDLAVAIISGIAAAYSKSFREIIQSLAGVAIAVALVPPLAVAGIGLGRGDFDFFFLAFLLFSTNLIGIVLAATFTFRLLGFSPAVHSKRGMGFIILLLMLISVPLSLSYNRIVANENYQQRLLTERFLVNGKYIIINKAEIRASHKGDREIIFMEILARETLDRHDLNLLKKKIQYYYDTKPIIRTKIIYIL